MTAGSQGSISYISGGRDPEGPILLLLHGLGATKEVWLTFIESLESVWSGAWMAPDFPGHGESAPVRHHSFGTYASAIGSIVPADRPITILGHSLGGVVGLLLGSGLFGLDVRDVHALSVKISWSPSDVEKALAFSRTVPKVFDQEADAVARHLKVSGLDGLVAPTHPAARAGIIATSEGWRIAASPATSAVAAGDVPAILKICRCPVRMATGELDPIASAASYESLPFDVTILSGLAHNAHVQDPTAVLAWFAAGASRQEMF